MPRGLPPARRRPGTGRACSSSHSSFLDTPGEINYPREKQMHAQRIPSQSDLLQLFRKAGLRAPTGLQQKVIPLVLKGKDLVAQAEKGAGATVAIVASLIVGIRGGETRPRAL